MTSFYYTTNHVLMNNIDKQQYLPGDWLGIIARAAPWVGIDRTKTFSHKLKYIIKDTDLIPSDWYTDVLLHDIMYKRAVFLLHRYQDREINFYWSGGIDSTLALIYFLHAGAQNLDNFTVVLENKSIIEYPLFFKKHIDDVLAYKLLPVHFRSRMILGINVVSILAELGDQLLGNVSASKYYIDDLDKNWKYVLEDKTKAFFPHIQEESRFSYVSDYIQSKEGRNYIISLLEAHLEQCPLPDKTLFTTLWWLNFTLKWIICKYRNFIFYTKSSKLTKDEFTSIDTFYDDIDLQRWSMSNPHLKIENTRESYKFYFKDLIYKYTKDANYRDQKLKVASGRLTGSNNPTNLNFTDTMLSLDSDLNLISYEKLCNPILLKQYMN